MDKIVINNQIVLMRKFVKQAKTRIINKCAKQIKALQNKKGNENQMLKYQRKKERLLKEIAILKGMKLDFVSKLALSKAKDWELILKQKNISLEEKCLSLLANYATVKNEVDKFYFNQSHLISKIPNLLLEWEAKNQNPNDTSLKNSKGKISKQKTKNSEFRNASFPNNIKVAKRTEMPVSSKPMLPHLASNNSVKTESSKQIVEQHSDSMESNIKEKIKLREFLSENNHLLVKNENSKRKLRNSDGKEFLEKKSLDFQSSDNINDSDNTCHMKNSVSETALCKSKKENVANNKNEDIFSHDISDIEMEGSDESDSGHHSELSNREKAVTHDDSDIEMEESEENVSDHLSEIDHSEISPSVVADKKAPEHAKILLKDKEVHKKLDLKKYLQPLKSASENVSVSLKSASENVSVSLKSASENNVSVNSKPTIVTKLEAISRSNLKKPDTNQKNTKAIAELDINKIQDLDEIPLENAPNLEKPDNKVITHKSDSFFLTADDSPNDDLEIKEDCTKIKMPFKSRRSDSNKRALNSNFNGKRLADVSLHKKKIFRGDANFHQQKNGEHFFKKDKDSNFISRKKFNLKEKRNFVDKNQSGHKRNYDFGRKTPSEFPRPNQKNSGPKSFQQNKDGYTKKEVEDKKPIHPSWEAKQKMKESLKIGFQGKRVVFS